MTVNVHIHVNGNYQATVTQDEGEPVVIKGNTPGETPSLTFHLPASGRSVFTVEEQPLPEAEQRAGD